MTEKKILDFRKTVWTYYRTHGRHNLPWRKTKNPYRILVSEVMLQQTQVPRVIEKYKEFLENFPTASALAKASLADVLRLWSGLGYNRRGKYLHDAAKAIIGTHKGNVRQALEHPLPGVGPYTKAAVKAFAFNEPDVLLETNVRAAFIHHFFPNTKQVNDRRIIMYAEKVAKNQDPREWHWALMDYGVHIKKLHKNPARRSSGYVRQSKFEGSLRQVRGAILRELHRGPMSLLNLLGRLNLTSRHKNTPALNKLPFEKNRIEIALATLSRDGLVKKQKGKWSIS